MSDLSQVLDYISSQQAQPEVRVNEALDALSIASLFGRRAATCTGFTWGYYGGRIPVNGVMTSIAHGTIALSSNATNYLSVDRTGTVNKDTGDWRPGEAPLYKVVCSTTAVTGWEDHRSPQAFGRVFLGYASIAMADANVTLSAVQALCDVLELTGSHSALRDVIVPAVQRRYTVLVATTGGYGVRFKAASGAGITVADGRAAELFFNGTNMRRVTADVDYTA